jgi:membrane protein required for colicin V production
VSALGFTGVDWIVLAAIALSAIVALWRGFVREVLSIVGWIGAILGTLYLFPIGQQLARKYIEWPIVADIVAGVVLFVAILVALTMIASAIAKRVQQSSINALDRSLGFLFGLVRGAVVVCLIYLLYSRAVPPKEQHTLVREARLASLVAIGADWLYMLVPAEYRSKGDAAVRDAKGAVDQGVQAKKAFDSVGGALPKAAQDLEQEKGYKPGDRQGMEQLLRNSPAR